MQDNISGSLEEVNYEPSAVLKRWPKNKKEKRPTRQEGPPSFRWVPGTGPSTQLQSRWTETGHPHEQQTGAAHDQQRWSRWDS